MTKCVCPTKTAGKSLILRLPSKWVGCPFANVCVPHSGLELVSAIGGIGAISMTHS